VSAIGHYLESEGIATASISLVREHTEVMQPPRALWVPFPLGRPLGVAHHADFQRRVLRALLSLFERVSGPVLEDFPEDAPADVLNEADHGQGEACPVFFGSQASPSNASTAARLQAEIAALAPWQALAARRRGASAFGLSGLAPSALADTLVALTEASTTTVSDWQRVKLAVDDLRTYYEEAAAAQPAPLPPAELEQWFYRQTAVGALLRDLRAVGMAHADAPVRLIAERMLIPRRLL
jgi:hypothetical protein